MCALGGRLGNQQSEHLSSLMFWGTMCCPVLGGHSCLTGAPGALDRAILWLECCGLRPTLPPHPFTSHACSLTGPCTLEASAKAQTPPVTSLMRPSPKFRMGSKQAARLGRQVSSSSQSSEDVGPHAWSHGQPCQAGSRIWSWPPESPFHCLQASWCHTKQSTRVWQEEGQPLQPSHCGGTYCRDYPRPDSHFLGTLSTCCIIAPSKLHHT